MSDCNRISVRNLYREPIELTAGKNGGDRRAIVSVIVKRNLFFKSAYRCGKAASCIHVARNRVSHFVSIVKTGLEAEICLL